MSKIDDYILGIRTDMEKLATKESADLLKAYSRALERVRKDLAEIYMVYDVTGELKIGKVQRYNILMQLEKKLMKQANELGIQDVGIASKVLEDVYNESYYRTAYILDTGFEAGLNFAILNPEFVKTAISIPIEGKMFSARIWDNKAKLVARVRDSVERALIDGVDIRKLAREVTKDFGSSIYESQRLIRTEVARVHTQASMSLFENSGVVRKIMWSATLDDKTNPEDALLDGNMWGVNEPHPTPPLHPNCRCCLVPVVDGWSPSKRRDQESGEVIDYKNYEKWKSEKGID